MGDAEDGAAGPAAAGLPVTGLWWRDRALQRIWAVLTERIEQRGLVASGHAAIGDLSRQERRAVSDLLGRDVLQGRVRVDLADLDARLRRRAGIGLVDAAGRIAGRALVDRRTVRAELSARRAAPYAELAAWRQEHATDLPGAEPGSAHGAADWLDGWLEGCHRDGVLGRDRDPGGLVRSALEVLWHRWAHLVGASPTVRPIARTELAARLLGDAHALDDDRRVAAVILRAVALRAADLPSPSRRELWERIGVLPDRVSTTCLTWGLRPAPGSSLADLAAAHGRAGAAWHLTWRDLDSGIAFETGQTVLVCENPRVLEAAADARLSGVGLVCASGRPGIVTVEVLRRLGDAQGRLLYHGDFDWPGIAIANDLVRRCGVVPWQMSAADYLGVPARLPLTGAQVEASWDRQLAPAMTRRGLVVHEEATLPGLIAELGGLRAG